MRYLQFLFLALIVLIDLAYSRAEAQNSDPQDSFMQAFMAFQQGEKLERDGRLKPALTKLRFAAALMDQIRANAPDWQPLVIEYRSRKIKESLDRVEKRLSLEQAAVAPPPSEQIPSSLPLPTVDRTRQTTSEEQIRPALPVEQEDPLPSRNGDLVVEPPANSRTTSKEIRALEAKLAKLELDLGKTKEQLAESRKENKGLQQQLKESNAKLKTVQKEVETAKKSEEEIRSQLAKAQETIKTMEANAESKKELRKQIENLTAQLAEAEKASKTKAKENEDLTVQLADAKTQLQSMNAEREALVKERDEATAQAKQAKEATEKVEVLIAEKTSLSQKLTETENKIQSLTSDTTSLPALRAELDKVREELAAARKENEAYEIAVADYRNQLDEMNAELQKQKDAANNPDETAKLTAEVDVLKKIVIRQLKEQARREQAKKLVLEELDKLQVRSEQLSQQLGILSEPIIKLTDEERQLFKEPQMELVDGETSDVAVSIVMAMPINSEPAANTEPLTPGLSSTATPGELPNSAPSTTQGGDTTTSSSGSPAVITATKPKVPEDLVPIAVEARQMFERGKYRDAEKLYDKILSREPKNLYALSNLGVVQFRSGKLKSAEVTYKKATTIAPEDAFSFAMLGIVYYQQGRFDDAIDVLTKAIQIDPKNAPAHNYLGITASQKGWQEAAEEELQKAIQINPKYADAHFNLAVVYATSAPPSKELARRHYSQAVQLGADPDASLESLIQQQ